MEYGVKSITKEQYDYWKQQEESSVYIFTDGHIGYDRNEHTTKFEAIPETFRFKKDLDEPWYMTCLQYDIDLFGGYFVMTESFGEWEFELFANLEDFITKFKVPDNRKRLSAPQQKPDKYYLHVRSVERALFEQGLDEPIKFADVTVNMFELATLGIRYVEYIFTEKIGTDSYQFNDRRRWCWGDRHCWGYPSTNMAYF